MPRIIISMTSFPAAIAYAEKAIQSLLQGSILPDKIVLYLTFSEFGEAGIPESLKELERNNQIFEIRNYERRIGPYTKLIPALKDFPDDVIVTVDDDVDYHAHMLRDLLKIYAKIPHAIIANRAKRIKKTKPYKKWKLFRWYDFLFKRIHLGHKILPTGVGGVLYPPHCLHPEMLNPDVFMSIAPTTDDIWFWAAATRMGVPIVPVPFGVCKPRGLGKPRSLALKWINFKAGEDRNVAVFNKILAEYPDIKDKIE